MELWFIAAVIAALSNGVYSFVAKIAAKKKFDTDILLLHSYAWGLVAAVGLFIYKDVDLAVKVLPILVLLSFSAEIFYYFGSKTRIRSLEYIDSSVYFPMYKTLGPILVSMIGIFAYSEFLTTKEWIGVVLGIVTSLLLLSKSESGVKDFKKGIIFMVISTFLTTVSYSISKYIAESGMSIETYVVIVSIVGILIGLTQKRKELKKVFKFNLEEKNLYMSGFIKGVTGLISVYFGTISLLGNMAVAYTISSFSILITIILSVIFYEEEMNVRRVISIFLSILVLLLFI